MPFQSVVTLVATLPHAPLEFKQIQAVRHALQGAGGEVGEAVWLGEGEAADIFFDGLALETARDIALSVVAQVDAIAQPVRHRRKRLLVADMDSTIIHQECLDELADAAGIKAEIAAITEAAMRGELDFAAALKARVARLKGLPLSALAITRNKLTLMEGAKTLVQTMRAHGAECHLVSGGFRYFTKYIADTVGFHSDRSNEFVVENGALTGAVVEPILGKEAKLEALHAFTAQLGLLPEETMAVGDGANDLPMLHAAGLGVAYHAKPAVAAATSARVTHSTLTALLYLQGYQKSEFV